MSVSFFFSTSLSPVCSTFSSVNSVTAVSSVSEALTAQLKNSKHETTSQSKHQFIPFSRRGRQKMFLSGKRNDARPKHFKLGKTVNSYGTKLSKGAFVWEYSGIRMYSGIYSGYSAPGSRIARIESSYSGMRIAPKHTLTCIIPIILIPDWSQTNASPELHFDLAKCSFGTHFLFKSVLSSNVRENNGLQEIASHIIFNCNRHHISFC